MDPVALLGAAADGGTVEAGGTVELGAVDEGDGFADPDGVDLGGVVVEDLGGVVVEAGGVADPDGVDLGGAVVEVDDEPGADVELGGVVGEAVDVGGVDFGGVVRDGTVVRGVVGRAGAAGGLLVMLLSDGRKDSRAAGMRTEPEDAIDGNAVASVDALFCGGGAAAGAWACAWVVGPDLTGAPALGSWC